MPQFCVGDDAHIVPANMTDFSKIFGEFVGAPTNLPEVPKSL